MSTTLESISLHVTIHLNPEDLPTFWAAMKPVYEAVIAEPECTFFEIYQVPDAPGTLSWVENWYVPLLEPCAYHPSIYIPYIQEKIPRLSVVNFTGPRHKNGFWK
ncbi:hypothetical protein ABOM_001712 [Aspergillus bombycis]|uniref:ABM domain-containing protein n=1 Tax=Aspergillus bombycis TaxID=109264 RepID=A0A1F8ACK5_9EURO|nr:hypothetical protein ABOM_001712 [Aspergillus bombycis]OGM49464.1 hypothetical protein ABOM_001712 [Aspergillus bombycis]